MKRFFAVTSLNKGRWYWVVWPSLEELQASTKPLLHIGEGYEKTKAEAVERALALARRYAAWIPAKFARAYHSSVHEAYRRLVKHAHPDGGGTHDEFLALQEAYEQALKLFPQGRNNGNG